MKFCDGVEHDAKMKPLDFNRDPGSFVDVEYRVILPLGNMRKLTLCSVSLERILTECEGSDE